MDFVKELDRDSLLTVSEPFPCLTPFLNFIDPTQVLHAAIDRIYKKHEVPIKKLSVSTEELDYISGIFIQYCSNQLNKSEMLDYFPVSPELKDCVFKAIETRKLQVCKYLLDEHNSKSIPLMKSFDWDIKFVIGNSSLASYREQLATLILECEKNGKSETITMEMNETALESLIKSLENCCGANE